MSDPDNQQSYQQMLSQKREKDHSTLSIIGFVLAFIPLVGLFISTYAWRNAKAKDEKTNLPFAGVIVAIVVTVLSVIFLFFVLNYGLPTNFLPEIHPEPLA